MRRSRLIVVRSELPRRSFARRRSVGQRRERERKAGEVLDEPVVEIEATRRRSRAEAAIACRAGLALLVSRAAACGSATRASGTWIEQDQGDRPEDRRRKRREQSSCARRDRAEALVDLEQAAGFPTGVRIRVYALITRPCPRSSTFSGRSGRSPRPSRRLRAAGGAGRHRARSGADLGGSSE